MDKAVFGTKEWAKYNMNCYHGCQHDCKYCYAKAGSVRQQRLIKNWPNVELRKGMEKKGFAKRNGRIMFPSRHDIHPDNLKFTIDFIGRMLKPKNELLIVSKPHPKCINEICEKFADYKDLILFRFTIGSIDDNVLKFWEPNAPSFSERLVSLKTAFNYGFGTSISSEPMLDNNIEAVIDEVEKYVTNSIWLGKANYLIQRLKINGFTNDVETMAMGRQLIQWQSDENILKLYEKYKDNKKIKWKESIKKVVGIEVPTEAGLDE